MCSSITSMNCRALMDYSSGHSNNTLNALVNPLLSTLLIQAAFLTLESRADISGLTDISPCSVLGDGVGPSQSLDKHNLTLVSVLKPRSSVTWTLVEAVAARPRELIWREDPVSHGFQEEIFHLFYFRFVVFKNRILQEGKMLYYVNKRRQMSSRERKNISISTQLRKSRPTLIKK